MKIALFEPFFTSSHAAWAKQLQQYSRHDIQLYTLPGRYWKWRMYNAAVTMAQMVLQSGDFEADLILCSDMLDVATFLGLTRSKTAQIPTAVYFHENQLTYPWSPTDKDVVLKRDNHYAFVNYTTALAADKVFFNSAYHKNSFLNALPDFLKQFPDYHNLETIDQIAAKSEVLHLGLDLKRFDKHRPAKPLPKTAESPIILWNHRWEYDKNPEEFFKALFVLVDKGIDFQLVVLGEHYKKIPAIFKQAKEKLAAQILHWGYVDSFAEYAQWLWQADILPVTSNQEFFGISVVEAMYCDCMPLLPKRLAYPEHIPQTLQKVYLYNQFEDFVGKLIMQLQHVGTKKATPNGQKWVAHYDWQNCIDTYDNAFAVCSAS